jgi:hypothetical protein
LEGKRCWLYARDRDRTTDLRALAELGRSGERHGSY